MKTEIHPFGMFATFWVFCIFIPSSAITWQLSGGRFLPSFLSIFVVPFLAVAQGTIGILKHKARYASAPHPRSPSHGVVIVNKKSKMANSEPDNASADNREVDENSELTNVKQNAMTSDTLHTEEVLSSMDTTKGVIHSRPIRLLVIGDSLAVGVGQSRNATPVLPEVIATTLSRELDGRPVFWTCHGFPGASTGWIVRELERGLGVVEESENDEYDDIDDNDIHITTTTTTTTNDDDEVGYMTICNDQQIDSRKGNLYESQSMSNASDTDESSSDESATDRTKQRADFSKGERKMWRKRLAQHRKLFHPETLGPYDVVVVITGANDVKFDYFPFFLKGDEALLRREAHKRGSDFTIELKRVLKTLSQRMQLQLQNIRNSVEAATETMLELAEETIERIGSRDPIQANTSRDFGSYYHEKMEAKKGSLLTQSLLDDVDDPVNRIDGNLPKRYPLVVLPGLPVRAAPFFRQYPLRWMAVYAYDVQDMHRRIVARLNPGHVLFVPPVSYDELVSYENGTGEFWKQRCEENTLLSLRDIRRQDCEDIEKRMRIFHEKTDPRKPTGQGLITTPDNTGWFSWINYRFSPTPGFSLFTPDLIHPTDDGYDCWGRQVSNEILNEMRLHPNLNS